jgi:hypothetical protein
MVGIHNQIPGFEIPAGIMHRFGASHFRESGQVADTLARGEPMNRPNKFLDLVRRPTGTGSIFVVEQ